MAKTYKVDRDRRAAIVCPHIGIDRAAILRAVRDEPIFGEDSGWQFLCNSNDEKSELAQVWAVEEVIEYEPSLARFIELPPRAVLVRLDASSEWKVELG